MIKQNLFTGYDFIRNLYKGRSMLWAMAIRELRAQYIGSVFGFVWAVFQPLIFLAIYGIIFGVFFNSKPDSVYGTDSYLLTLLCGLVPWLFFSQTVNQATNSLIANSNLIKKAVGFPSEVLPIVTVINNLIQHFIGIVILLLIVVLVTGKLTPYTPVIFVYLFFTSVLAVGLGWILSSLNVYLRDVTQVLELILLGMFFFTPIFYSPSIVPSKYLPFLQLNPVFHLVEGYRYVLLAGRLPSPYGMVYLAGISIFVFAIGGVFFKKLKPGFAEVL